MFEVWRSWSSELERSSGVDLVVVVLLTKLEATTAESLRNLNLCSLLKLVPRLHHTEGSADITAISSLSHRA